MSEMIHGPWPEHTETLSVIDDDGNEIEIHPEEFWQYQQDAMRYTPDNNHEGER